VIVHIALPEQGWPVGTAAISHWVPRHLPAGAGGQLMLVARFAHAAPMAASADSMVPLPLLLLQADRMLTSSTARIRRLIDLAYHGGPPDAARHRTGHAERLVARSRSCSA